MGLITGVTPRRSRRSQSATMQRSVADMFSNAPVTKRKSVETEVKEEIEEDEQESKRQRVKIEKAEDEEKKKQQQSSEEK